MAWLGKAWLGRARLGMARTAGASLLLYAQLPQIYHKLYSGSGRVGLGGAGLGGARQGKGTGLQNPVHYA